MVADQTMQAKPAAKTRYLRAFKVQAPQVYFLGSRHRRHCGCETLRKITTLTNPGSLEQFIEVDGKRDHPSS